MRFDPDNQLARAYLQRHDNLGPLAERAAHLIEIRRLCRQILPEGLSRSSEVANYRQGVVVIDADNGAVAVKLKQLAPRITAMLLERGWQVSAIRVRVQART